ncbi:hypothetical protein GA0070609_0607 [Micromonospora echinaurantiaca]|uniref:Uncharacterized protein n=1 Tax=Micromonospora echinaurantiaca TaxID=47857 RepID=A0A1C5GXU4_9ACTN|nr:hypothetical protein [Micromonospora echinaurantiaca]SCG38629.1 hypothetical protein GA0070609_0607 [Micromonospora echinaurantiaca]
MRRLLAITVVATALLVPAGCAADRTAVGPVTPAASAGALTSGPVASGAAGGDATGACAAARQAGATAVTTYVEEVGRMLAAIGANDTATAETARRRAEAALTGWRTALRQQAERAADPQLKTLLADLAGEVAALGTDLDAIDETELDRLQQRLDQVCGR